MTSPCDTCPRPGVCCHGFTLSLCIWDDTDAHEQWEEARENPRYLRHDDESLRLPFELLCRADDIERQIAPGGRTWSQWRFTCPKLGADGRCTIYATRPEVCRHMQPTSDPICALHPEHQGFLDVLVKSGHPHSK